MNGKANRFYIVCLITESTGINRYIGDYWWKRARVYNLGLKNQSMRQSFGSGSPASRCHSRSRTMLNRSTKFEGTGWHGDHRCFPDSPRFLQPALFRIVPGLRWMETDAPKCRIRHLVRSRWQCPPCAVREHTMLCLYGA